MSGDNRPIILFDGVCNLCNASVNFVIDRDPAGRFTFASLQSPAGQALLSRFGLPSEALSVVLIEGDRSYLRSSAALRVARRLGGLWPLTSVFMMIPRPIRDIVYDFIAHNRYRWFGRQDVCRTPNPDLLSRLLPDGSIPPLAAH